MQALFEQHQAWAASVARSVRRKLPPSFDIEDLVQEALIEHWKQVQRFDPSWRVPYQGFAWRAVHGAVVMACRRRQYRDATHEELTGQHVDQRPGPDKVLLDREERRNVTGPRESRQLAKVGDAMSRLASAEAYLVRRVFLENADVEALAATWGVKPEHLRRRLAAAVRVLKVEVHQTRASQFVA